MNLAYVRCGWASQVIECGRGFWTRINKGAGGCTTIHEYVMCEEGGVRA